MDRSRTATLVTHNAWIQLSRLQKIYLFHNTQLFITTPRFDTHRGFTATGLRPNACHVAIETLDNIAYPAWIPI